MSIYGNLLSENVRLAIEEAKSITLKKDQIINNLKSIINKGEYKYYFINYIESSNDKPIEISIYGYNKPLKKKRGFSLGTYVRDKELFFIESYNIKGSFDIEYLGDLKKYTNYNSLFEKSSTN